MAGDRMPRIDMEKEINKFSDKDRFFIKKVTEMNKNRALDRFVIQHRNKWMGLLIFGGVVSIYFYTMNAVQQETFLDELEPEKK